MAVRLCILFTIHIFILRKKFLNYYEDRIFETLWFTDPLLLIFYSLKLVVYYDLNYITHKSHWFVVETYKIPQRNIVKSLLKMPSENESKILKMNPKMWSLSLSSEEIKWDSLLKYLSHNSGKTQIGQDFTFFSVVHQNFGQINPRSLVRAHKQGFIGVMQGCHLQLYDLYT